MTTLEQVLQARRTMDHVATWAPADLFEIAKNDYLTKLKDYHGNNNSASNQNQLELFLVSEEQRAQRLSLFNSSGSNYVDTGNDKKARGRLADGRS